MTELCHMLLDSGDMCPNEAKYVDGEMQICADHAEAVVALSASVLISETESFLDDRPA